MTQVRCTNHGGQHTGRIVNRMGPLVAVAWDGYVAVPRTADEKRAMRALARAHDLVAVPAGEVESL